MIDINILYLVNRKYYINKLARERFLSMEAIGRACSSVTFWGIGWDGYNNNHSVSWNIEKRGISYDIVICYKPLEYKDFKNVRIPKCIRYNEMWDVKWTLREIKQSGSQLVICHHLNDCKRYSGMNIPDVKFVYVGHCYDPSIFKSYDKPKKYDFMFGGHVSQRHYPLRARLRNILNGMSRKYKVYIHPHPGYDLSDAHTNRYLIDFAKKISESKIAVTCSSKYRYRLGKYVEIPACNTVLAADIPADDADDYSYIVRLDNSMSDNEIRHVLEEYLLNSDKYEEKLLLGRDFAMEYTWDKYATRVLGKICEFLKIQQ